MYTNLVGEQFRCLLENLRKMLQKLDRQFLICPLCTMVASQVMQQHVLQDILEPKTSRFQSSIIPIFTQECNEKNAQIALEIFQVFERIFICFQNTT